MWTEGMCGNVDHPKRGLISFLLGHFLYMVDSPKVGQLLILSQFLGKMKNIARS